MQRGLKSRNYVITKSQRAQRGYMLITLMLALALITIALLAVLPDVGQQIRRDREEEMRHRGTAYMRAIQHFHRKFGRYPSRIEDLENTNNFRFLRKRYTDPLNVDRATDKERDFKLLRQTDVSLNNGPVLGQTPGQASLLNGVQGPGGFGVQPSGIQQTGSAQSPATGDSNGSTNTTGNSKTGDSNSRDRPRIPIHAPA
jgi:type II secretory pathway pseudopilin PulG